MMANIRLNYSAVIRAYELNTGNLTAALVRTATNSPNSVENTFSF